MSTVIINPGSGDAAEYGRCSEHSAAANMRRFVEDLRIEGVKHWRLSKREHGGRYRFKVRYEKRIAYVEMPAVALLRVRYVGDEGQNIWDFPRLYVNGNSYVWLYALAVLRDGLLGE